MNTVAVFTLMKDGGSLAPGRVVLALAILLVTYAAFTLAQRFLVRNALLRSVSLQLNLLVLTLLSMIFLTPMQSQVNPYIPCAISAAAVFLAVITGLKLFDKIFFELIAPWRKKPPVPILIRDIGRWTISAIALVMIVRGFFPGVNLSVLAVSSLVAGYILGNATQDTLSHLVAGLALNTESPFQIGDWVTVGGNTGVVVDTTWRATSLRTKADDYIVIPNASIGREPIINYSRPTRSHGCYSAIAVDNLIPPNKVRAAILEALAGVPDVLTTPAPVVLLASYNNFLLNFTIKYFVDDFARTDPIQSLVMDRIWYALYRAGISLEIPTQNNRIINTGAEKHRELKSRRADLVDLFKGVDLFGSLSGAELEKLAEVVHPLQFATGEVLCRQGDPGDSFYVIKTGRVAISITGAGGTSVPVAELAAGAFFGEMSLFTGEARSATVTAGTDVEVCCVSKTDFSGLLRANAALTGKLAAILEKRAAERTERMATVTGSRPAPVTQTALADRIRKFFNLG